MNREASIRVTLRSGAFASGMRKMVSDARTAGTQMAGALKGPMKAGLKEMKSSAKDFAKTMGGGIKSAATLGGAVGFGALVHGAMQAEDSAIRLAATLSTYQGKAVSAAEAQGMLERAAGKTKTSFEENRAVLAQLSSIKGLDNVEEAMVRSQLQAKRLGVEGTLVARVYTRLIAKGVASSAKEAEVLTEQMSKFGRTVLGIDPDEAIDPNDMAEFASFTNLAGLNMSKAQKIFKLTGADFAKDFGEAATIVEEFGNVFKDAGSLGELRKALQISPKDLNTSKDSLENMFTILEKAGPKGVKTLLTSFGNERTKGALRKMLGAELVVDIEKGKGGPALKQRTAELRKLFAEAEDDGVDMKEIAKRNAEITSSSSAKFQSALNELQLAFQKPEVIQAINDLANHLPKLAKALSKIVDFTMKNPLTAGAAVVGVKLGGSFASGFLADAGTSFAKQAAPALAQGGASFGRLAAGAISPKGSNFGMAAGRAMGVAAAAIIGVEIGKYLGKEVVGADFDKASQTASGLKGAQIAAEAAQSTERKQEMLKVLEERIAAAKQEQGTGASRFIPKSAGDFASLLLGPMGLVSKKQAEQKLSGVAEAESAAAKLRAELSTNANAHKEGGRAVKELSQAARQAAFELAKVKPPDGGSSRGPAPVGPNVPPGAAPAGG